jgi:hypothetical protein
MVRVGRLGVGLGIGLVALLAGCADVPPSSAPGETIPPASVAPATVDPAYSAFRSRVQSGPREFGSFVRQLSDAQVEGPGAMRAVAALIRAWADAEAAWLQTHDAGACYAAGIAAYDAALGATREVADRFEATVAAASPSADDEQAAVTALQAATDAFDEAAAVTRAALEDCR